MRWLIIAFVMIVNDLILCKKPNSYFERLNDANKRHQVSATRTQLPEVTSYLDK